jgi:hypothetical protein
MTAQAHDTTTTTTARPADRAGTRAARPADRADPRAARPGDRAGTRAARPGDRAGTRAARPGDRAGTRAARPGDRAGTRAVRLSQRDIDGLLLCGEHYGAPGDLLARALRVQPERVPAIAARWRRAGYAATGRLGPGPAWCWLTRDGMAATGLGFPAARPALGRLAHIRAVLAARLWLASGPAWHDGQAWWHSERRLRAARPPQAAGHVPDAEIHWPSLPHSPYAGQVWAVEVELTPKPVDRTCRIMAGLLSPMRYALVLYLAAPRALPVVTRAAAALPPAERPRITIRELPEAAFLPEPPR